jgi:hypothetical protein
MSDNGGSAVVVATPITGTLTVLATNNTISSINDNAIALISSGSTTTGNITINNNAITDIGNGSNGIAVSQDFSTLNLTILNNEINDCEGTGIFSYAPNGTTTATLNVSNNTVSDCQNLSTNAAGGINIEQYTSLAASVTNNALSNNTSTAVFIGSALTAPTTCLTLSGNTNTNEYVLNNPVDGVFNLSPCNAETENTGMISTPGMGMVDSVQSCPGAVPCPP